MSEQDEHLPDTASMDIYLLGPPSLILPTLEKLQIVTLKDLIDLDEERLESMRGVGKAKVQAIVELRARAIEAADAELDLLSLADKETTTRYIIDELIAVGIDPDRDWRELLGQLGTRTHNLLEKGELTTLREVILRYEANTLNRISGFGEATARELGEHLDRLVTSGPEGYIWGSRGKPETLRGAITRLLEVSGQEHESLLQKRYGRGLTLEEIGDGLGISRERVRQRLDRDMGIARRRWGASLKEWLEPLLTLLDESGGILGKVRVKGITDGAPTWMLLLTLDLLGHEARWIHPERTLTQLDQKEYERIWNTLREYIEESGEEQLPLESLADHAATLGWYTTPEEFSYLARHQWGARTNFEDGNLINPWQDLHTLYARIVQQVADSITASELAGLIQERLDLERPPSERHIYTYLSRVDEIYYVDRGVYMHRDALPVPIERLEQLAEELIEALDGTAHAVSAKTLLEQQPDETMRELNPMLMRDIMGRDPRIQIFQATDMVAHLSTFSGQRKTQLDHVAKILSKAGQPLTCAQVCERMPEHVSFHQGAVYTKLQEAPFALNLGQGRFLHRDAIGLTDAMLAALVDDAADALREAGRPITASRLLASQTSPAAAFLTVHEHGAAILFALLGKHADVVCGSGGLVQTIDGVGTDDDPRPTITAICDILQEHVVLTPGELLDRIEEAHGWEASSGPIYYALEIAEEAQIIERVFARYRALWNTDEDALFAAIAARDESHDSVYTIARRAAGTPEELERFARYLRHQGLDEAADELLSGGDDA